MIHLPFWQQLTELLPDGLNDVWLDGGHGLASSSGSSVTPQMIEHPVSGCHPGASRPYPRRL
jgi:hypothetical protein